MEYWTEISVDLSEKLSLLVDDYLKGLGSVGNVMQTLVRDEAQHLIRPCLKGYLRGSVNENKNNIDAFKAFISSLQEVFPEGQVGKVNVKETSQEDWEGWKKFFKPTSVSKRVVIKPSWEQYSPSSGEVIIDIDPGMAFGTGTHETTRLCIRLLDKIIKGSEELLDIGTGSGILAIVAARLGVVKVKAIDNDESVIKIARENIINNGVENNIEVSATPLENLSSKFDIIVANILAETLIDMTKEIICHINRGGSIILSGILNSQIRKVADAYVKNGVQLEEVLGDGEWGALLFKG
ncbi:MAG: 50S ribosomal protein L11 methyltransferase [Proteobacteria bacterium]|nr:50S ribosomal protein L11 methyltransferase [Pseudomonadota bacterium]